MNDSSPKWFIPLLILIGFSTLNLQAQLGFCGGSSGDPIFTEDFGTGLTDGPALPAGTTTYNFTTGTPSDGDYTISSTTNYFDWLNTQDHTPGDTNGKSFIVNASFTAGEFYQRQVDGLCENTTYEFSSWLINLQAQGGCEGNSIPVNVRFQIWDETDTNLLGQGDTGNILTSATPIWEQYALVFKTLPGQTSVILKMRNNSNGGCGNDLAIDDIVFRSCGDSVAVATDQNEISITVCEDQGTVSTTLEATPDFSIFTTHAYQWQESTDEVNWTDISGATNNNFTTPQVSSTSFYRVKVAEDALNVSNDLCNVLSDVFEILIVPIPLAPTNNGDVTRCANESVPLSVSAPNNFTINWYDSPSGGTLLLENDANFNPNQAGTYYAEMNSTLIDCPSTSRTPVTLTINELPAVQDEALTFCENTTILLSADLDNVDYQWSSGAITKDIEVGTPGEYSVLVTDANGCSNTKVIVLEQIDLPIIESITSDGPSIIVKTENDGDFEYAIDTTNYQDSPFFEAVTGGRYTIYVRDKAGCGVISQEYQHLVIPKFFTPNGDTINDVFAAEGLEAFNDNQLFIFDRFGKLLKSGSRDSAFWDGTLNGQELPAGNYWYRIIVDGSTYSGALALKR